MHLNVNFMCAQKELITTEQLTQAVWRKSFMRNCARDRRRRAWCEWAFTVVKLCLLFVISTAWMGAADLPWMHHCDEEQKAMLVTYCFVEIAKLGLCFHFYSITTFSLFKCGRLSIQEMAVVTNVYAICICSLVAWLCWNSVHVREDA